MSSRTRRPGQPGGDTSPSVAPQPLQERHVAAARAHFVGARGSPNPALPGLESGRRPPAPAGSLRRLAPLLRRPTPATSPPGARLAATPRRRSSRAMRRRLAADPVRPDLIRSAPSFSGHLERLRTSSLLARVLPRPDTPPPPTKHRPATRIPPPRSVSSRVDFSRG
nr:protein IQ-DOMAIN 14-like [Aegilops tauschii subsp. strangulata]